jgi:hypothetical protein
MSGTVVPGVRHGLARRLAAAPILPSQQRGLTMTWPRQDVLEFGPMPGAVPCARLHARLVLAEWGLARLAEPTEIIVSELVTNAVAATQRLEWIPTPPVRLWLLADSTQVLIAVWDANPRLPGRTEVDGLAESGRGCCSWKAWPRTGMPTPPHTTAGKSSARYARRAWPASRWVSSGRRGGEAWAGWVVPGAWLMTCGSWLITNGAATIMICVFVTFSLMNQRAIAEFGIGLAAAVALDAFVLRTILVPALMHMFGSANWLLPRWLDRRRKNSCAPAQPGQEKIFLMPGR